MKTFKQFLKEFDDIGNSVYFDYDKSKIDASKFIRKSRESHFFKSGSISPKELKKHSIKPLSSHKEHRGYTVHHITGKTGDGVHTAALLHHKEDGFIGSLFGHKHRNNFHISESFIKASHRGKGLGVALYDSAVKHHGAVVSDEVLSTASQRIYKHFAKKGRVSVHNPDYDQWTNQPPPHGQKVRVIPKGEKQGEMATKFISPNRLSNDGTLQLKIHKNKLK